MEDKSARKKPGAPGGAGGSAGGVAGGQPPVVTPAREASPGEVVSLDPARRAREEQNRRRKALDVPIHQHIGRQLKALYDDVVAQPVPDRFLALLRDIDAKTDGDDVK